MTWIGEDSGSGLLMFSEDGSPLSVPLGADGQVLSIENGAPKFSDPSVLGSGQHNLLSSTHLDTEPSSPSDGDLIYSSGNLWKKLIKGPDSNILTMKSGYPTWRSSQDILNENEQGIKVTDGVNEYSDNIELTTSTVYTILNPIVSMVGSGNFSLVFSSILESSRAGIVASIAAFVDGVQASGTERQISVQSANAPFVIATNGLVDVPASGEVSIRWKRIGGPPSTTLTATSRSLTLIRIRSIVNA